MRSIEDFWEPNNQGSNIHASSQYDLATFSHGKRLKSSREQISLRSPLRLIFSFSIWKLNFSAPFSLSRSEKKVFAHHFFSLNIWNEVRFGEKIGRLIPVPVNAVKAGW